MSHESQVRINIILYMIEIQNDRIFFFVTSDCKFEPLLLYFRKPLLYLCIYYLSIKLVYLNNRIKFKNIIVFYQSIIIFLLHLSFFSSIIFIYFFFLHTHTLK
jgi:hypothetical protein